MKKILTLSKKDKKNKNIIITYLKYLIDTFYNFDKYNNLISDNFLISLNSFHPLPISFITDFIDLSSIIIKENNNTILFIGKENEPIILFGDRPLPIYNINPIPFTFPIINDNNILLLNSNVYYYEIEMLEKHRNPWSIENIVIGYGTYDSKLKVLPGLEYCSFGYFSYDGTFNNQCQQLKISNPWNVGDIAGIGLIYNKNEYIPFLTLNGVLIKINIKINIKDVLTPIIGLNHSCKIKYNFGQSEFKFNIKDYLHNNIIHSNINDFMSSNCNIKKYSNIDIVKNKLSNSKLILINPLLINPLLPNFFTNIENQTQFTVLFNTNI
jgi:hypothetical protein